MRDDNYFIDNRYFTVVAGSEPERVYRDREDAMEMARALAQKGLDVTVTEWELVGRTLEVPGLKEEA